MSTGQQSSLPEEAEENHAFFLLFSISVCVSFTTSNSSSPLSLSQPPSSVTVLYVYTSRPSLPRVSSVLSDKVAPISARIRRKVRPAAPLSWKTDTNFLSFEGNFPLQLNSDNRFSRCKSKKLFVHCGSSEKELYQHNILEGEKEIGFLFCCGPLLT